MNRTLVGPQVHVQRRVWPVCLFEPLVITANHCFSRIDPSGFIGSSSPLPTTYQSRDFRNILSVSFRNHLTRRQHTQLLRSIHITMHGRQQKSHCVSPQGHEIHGFVEPLIGFLMLEATDDVDERGILLNEQDVSQVKKHYLHGLGGLSRASDTYFRL
jgi:hypothetical protein